MHALSSCLLLLLLRVDALTQLYATGVIVFYRQDCEIVELIFVTHIPAACSCFRCFKQQKHLLHNDVLSSIVDQC